MISGKGAKSAKNYQPIQSVSPDASGLPPHSKRRRFCSLCCLPAGIARAQTSIFTYQGKLTDGGTPANGNYDLQFALWDSAAAGTQIGSTQTVNGVAVSAGIFTVTLDFGANAFPGTNRFLEISARLSGGGSFTLLAPRQQITSTPYAVRSASATAADNATQLGGIPASGFIQNSSSTQASSKFNIDGNGTVGGTLSGNVVNSTTQYNLGGNRLISGAGVANLFIGFDAGAANATGNSNNFFGSIAGNSNTTGSQNNFFGWAAGPHNTKGSNNSFFGHGVGAANTEGSENAYFGLSSGLESTGNQNSFFGTQSGRGNFMGSGNTAVGYLTYFSSNLTNATAIGWLARVDQSNSLVLGSVAGVNSATSSVNVGIGTTAPQSRLHVNGTTWFQGDTTPLPNTAGSGIAIGYGGQAYIFAFDYSSLTPKNLLINHPGGNVGIGTTNPAAKLHVNGRIVVDDLGIGGDTPLCRNASHEIALCASSLRYKKDVARFQGGLDIINHLRPISFTWKDHPERDLGLGAEDVAAVEPLLVTKNDKGEIEGVKYDRLSAVFINAFKEQQKEIETLRAANVTLRKRLQSVEKSLRKRGGSARRPH